MPTDPDAHGAPAHPRDGTDDEADGPHGGADVGVDGHRDGSGDAASRPGERTSPGPTAAEPPAPATVTGSGLPPVPAPPAARPPRRRHVGRIVAVIALLLMAAFLVGATFVPLPYYLFKPGSVRDTEPLIAVEGTAVYESEGSIGYTTVSLRQATLLGLVQGWLDDDIDVFDRDRVLQGRDVNENREVNLQMMTSSKQVATQVALERLGYDIDVTVGQAVLEVMDGMPADGVLESGDVITAIDGEAFDDAEDLGRLLADERPGDTITATVRPPTGEAGRDVELELAESPDEPDRAVMGVAVSSLVLDYDFPVDVQIDTGDVGGPSAGLAFALAIIDDLTPGDLTGGEDVAVTGTISSDGVVGEVGGTGQKAAAVREAGVTLYLVPSADYEAAVARAGDDLEVVAVDTLDEALDALGDRGGNVDDLPEMGEIAASPAG